MFHWFQLITINKCALKNPDWVERTRNLIICAITCFMKTLHFIGEPKPHLRCGSLGQLQKKNSVGMFDLFWQYISPFTITIFLVDEFLSVLRSGIMTSSDLMIRDSQRVLIKISKNITYVSCFKQVTMQITLSAWCCYKRCNPFSVHS